MQTTAKAGTVETKPFPFPDLTKPEEGPHDIAIRAHMNATYSKPKEADVPVAVRAAEWLAKNPKVYAEFKRFTFEAVMLGVKRLSADMVAHRVRWETSVVRADPKGFKVNNNAVAYMARKFVEEHPQLSDLFEFRGSPGGESEGAAAQ